MTLTKLSFALALALSASIASAQGPEPILLDGPFVSFEGQRDAVVRWSTRGPTPTIVDYGFTGANEAELIEDLRPKTTHTVRLPNLARNSVYRYRILFSEDAGEDGTADYPLNTAFDFSAPAMPAVEPYPTDAFSETYARAAEYILAGSGIDRGYCIDLGCGDGRLGWEIAKRSQLHVVGFSSDAEAVQCGREALLRAGVYGSRITLRHADPGDLPIPDLCANLIISTEALTGAPPSASAESVTRKLRPEGGAAYIGVPLDAESRLAEWLSPASLSDLGQPVRPRLGAGSLAAWAVVRRDGPLSGAGEWTHAYADAGQSANSFDELVVGAAGETLEVQWFGLPGPDAMIDRQVRMQGPLSSAGRIYSQGNNRIITQDAYNGTILWSLEIPHMRRVNLPRNTGNACCDRRSLYLAVRDHCWRLDGVTGRRTASYHVTSDEADTSYDWGYVAVDEQRLYGSAVRRGNMDTGYIGPQFWFDHQSGPDTYNVCSDSLFALSKGSGEGLWTYQRGLIINPTISMAEGRLLFLESRSQAALESPARKLGPELWSDVSLVCLDSSTGDVLWQKPFDPGGPPIVIYLVAHDGLAAMVHSLGGAYHVRALSAATGDDVWQADDGWRSDNHGHHIQHPVIAQGRLHLEPHVYTWRSGEKLDVTFPSRSKCGTITGAAAMLHYRDYNDEVWDLRTDTQSEFNLLRSNCWVGMISGNGLLMSPESGGGCSCQWPIYTSLTYRAKDDYQ